MASSLYLTVLAGPVEVVPAPKPLIDALSSVEVTISDSGQSGFQLIFTLANRSPLQALFLLSAGAPIPMLRVILVATVGVIPQVLMDGVVTHHEVSPDAMRGSSTLTITGEDLTAVMNQVDMSGLPYPGMSPEMRVVTILSKYAVFGVVPNIVPAIAPDIPIPVDKIPTQKGTDLAYIRQLAKEAGYVFYLDPGPLPGIEPGLLGAADQGRYAAAGVECEHGCVDQRRKPDVPIRAAIRNSTCGLHPGRNDQSGPADSDSVGESA
jgi:hypothetical protein